MVCINEGNGDFTKIRKKGSVHNKDFLMYTKLLLKRCKNVGVFSEIFSVRIQRIYCLCTKLS